jgi:Ser/Thr protein kinase RdoA (MazF antagonist)
VPELRLSVQEYVDHRGSLNELFHIALSTGDADASAALLDAVRATAAGLAQLHQCRTSLGDPVTWDDELARLRKKHDRLMAATSTLRDGTSSMPDRLDAAAHATATVADPLVPAHHSFHPAQVLLTERGVAFIDFDKCCDAEPASDIALFTAKLMHMGANTIGTSDTADMREQHVAAVRRAFLDEYQRRAPVSADRIALWEALELSSLVLSAVKKVNREWIERCRRMLDDHLAANGW